MLCCPTYPSPSSTHRQFTGGSQSFFLCCPMQCCGRCSMEPMPSWCAACATMLLHDVQPCRLDHDRHALGHMMHSHPMAVQWPVTYRYYSGIAVLALYSSSFQDASVTCQPAEAAGQQHNAAINRPAAVPIDRTVVLCGRQCCMQLMAAVLVPLTVLSWTG
jgi:hypothetical protein